MRLLDSNIIIYGIQTAYAYLSPLFYESDSYISEITKLEVLGYHKFDAISKQDMTELFDSLQIIPIDSTIIDKAVELRQLRKMSIGDAVIAATAIIKDCEILSRNTSDFTRLGITVSNPV